MAFDLFNDTTTAIFSALFGGAGVKILDKMLSSRSQYLAETEQLQGSLRKELDRVTEESDEARKETDEWRDKYWKLVESNVALKANNANLEQELESLKADNNTLIFELEQLKKELDTPLDE